MENQRALFDLENDVHYLNCAYMSPLMRHVEEAGIKSIGQKVRPYHVGVEDFFDPVEQVRQQFSRIIKNDDPDRIAILPSVSYGIANVTHNLSLNAGEEIVLAADQFPSNVYPWMEIAERDSGKILLVQKPGSHAAGTWSERILDQIHSKTRVVSISHTHWADGSLFDLERIGNRCRDVDALFVIDGTQSIGALEFDQKRIKADAIICAGYKWLMGPYGIGVGYYGPWFDNKHPIEHNWINRKDSHDFKNLVNYQPELKPKGLKYAVGEQSNFILINMLLEALKSVNEWGTHAIQDHCAEIAGDALKELKHIGLNIPEAGIESAHHLFGIEIPETVAINKLKQALGHAKVHVSFRGNHIRVSPHVYNDKSDFNVLVHTISNVIHSVPTSS